MRIELGDNLIVTSDDKQFILCRIYNNPKGEKVLKNHKYYTTIDSLISGIMNDKLLSSEVKDLKELISTYKVLKEEMLDLKEKLLKVK